MIDVSFEDTGEVTESEPVAAPSKVGRFAVLELLGEGAMGRVMSAYDPDLDRRVAIKILRPRGGSANATRERLLREARAMARVAHPNVLGVHEVGVVDDQVFIVMEYALGGTLKTWFETKPGWREVVERMLDAGRGLAAAHEAGLIHRDFKPDNVLLTRDGSVRVADFGLVSVGGDVAPPVAPDENIALRQTLESPSLTRPGSMLGTPMYMAPEQYTGEPVGPATDQFAFCITLYEGLYGDYPFNSRSFGELFNEIVGARVKPPPASAGVPRWVERIVLRGLQREPAARFPSMAALIAALGDDPDARRARRRAYGAVGIGFVALAGLAAFGLAGRTDPAQARCEETADAVADMWSPAARLRLEAAFGSAANAHETTTRVAGLLDDHAARWRRGRIDACRARARGEQSAELVDRRMQCLDRDLAGMAALVRVFGEAPDRRVIDRAVPAVTELPAVEDCADTAALLDAHPEPRSVIAKAQVDAVRTSLDRARALSMTGQYARALELTQPATETARKLAFDPLLARALLTLSDELHEAGRYAESEATALEGLRVAARAGEDRLRVRLGLRLVEILGEREARYAEARTAAALVDADIARVGDPIESRTALAFQLGALDSLQGKYDDALRSFARWRELRESQPRLDSDDYALGLATIGDLYETLGRLDEARAMHERALAIRERAFGPEHPHVADSLNNLGVVLFDLGRYADADAAYRRALAIREHVLGKDHVLVAGTLNNLAGVLEADGRFEETLPMYERAIAIRSKALGPDHPRVAIIYNNLGETLAKMGRLEDAQAAFEHALAIREAKLGPDHPDLGSPLMNLGRVLVRRGKPTDGEARIRRALALWEKAFGAQNPKLSYPRAGLVEVYLATGRAGQAIPVAEAVVGARDVKDAAPMELAEARYLLARALWDGGGDRARARELASAARTAYAGRGRGSQHELADVDAWLAAHPPR
jgi:serine/threonine-protein kinase